MTAPIDLAKLKELATKATGGPWNFGNWCILDEDRPAQRRGEPYWTFFEGSPDGLYRALPGEKVRDPGRERSIIEGIGYECDGIDVSSADAAFISAANPAVILRLVEAFEVQRRELEKIAPEVGVEVSGDGVIRLHEAWASKALAQADAILRGEARDIPKPQRVEFEATVEGDHTCGFIDEALEKLCPFIGKRVKVTVEEVPRD